MISLARTRCPVRECGATVLIARIDSREVHLDPVEVEVAVAEADAVTLRRGYRLHAATCVNIAARQRRA